MVMKLCVVCECPFETKRNAKSCSVECSKVSTREYVRKYYKANVDHILEQQREYYEANVDHIRDRKREYQRGYQRGYQTTNSIEINRKRRRKRREKPIGVLLAANHNALMMKGDTQ